ncbi:MAG TPA: serine hydrolase domain-containing protein [Symbiobacteriaceae bacterium]|nr:serine hydrolase domain-containing protein [Symbiobacteriaceae bacterium]
MTVAVVNEAGLRSTQTATAIRHYVQQQLHEQRIPGAAVAVVAGGETVLLEGFGSTAAKGGRPVTPQTLFQIGSVTKSMTAMAVLQLRERGLIDLDAPVQQYLPWFRVKDEAASKQITVRHLLNQTSGLFNAAWKISLTDPAITESQANAVRAAAALPLHSPPGAKWQYSNMNYIILGQLVETITGEPYRQYMREHILAPLGMARAAFDYAEVQHHDHASHHMLKLGRLVEIEVDTAGWGDAAGLSLYCSAEDMARYAQAMLGAIPPEVIPPARLDELQTGTEPMDMNNLRYGFGWMSTNFHGRRAVFHAGGTGGHQAMIALLPEENLGVVVQANAFGQATGKIAVNILRILHGEAPDQPDFMPDLGKTFGAAIRVMTGLGILGLITAATAAVAGWSVHPVITAVLAAIALLLALMPSAMKRNPAIPLPIPIKGVGPGGWPVDMIAAWAAMLGGMAAWAIYGLFVWIR